MSTQDAAQAAVPDLEGPAPHLLIVRAPYYREIVDGLTEGAARILAEAGATHDIADVAGAFELPQAIRLAARAAASTGGPHFDGYVALGCVVRGETDHYEYICSAAMNGLMTVALQFGLALGAGLLTVDEIGQALDRAAPVGHPQHGHNKGAEAAAAALRQIALVRRLEKR